MYLWDAASLRFVRRLSGHQGLLDDISWSADSAKIATGDYFGVVRIWRADGEAPVVSHTVFSERSTHVSALAWAPQGSDTIAAVGWDKTVRLLQVQSQGLLETDSYTGHENYVEKIAWSPDGRRLASVAAKWGLVVHQLEAGLFTSSTDLGFKRGWNSVDDLRWSPNSAWLAVADTTGGAVRLWKAESREAFSPFDLQPVASDGASLMWSSDSASLAATNKKEVRLWSVPAGLVISRTGHGQGDDIFGPDVNLVGWSKAGNRIVWTSGRRFQITLFDVDKDKQTVLRPAALGPWLLGIRP